VPLAAVDAEYRRQRGACSSDFRGYAAYYLVRNNLRARHSGILREHPEYSEGPARSGAHDFVGGVWAVEIPHGVGLGSQQSEYFLPLGLILSCVIMAALRFVQDAVRPSLAYWSPSDHHGWVQGMGWPPCGKTMVHWFSNARTRPASSRSERPRTTWEARWSQFALVGVALFNDWGAKFYFNALIAAGVAVVVFSSCGHAAIAGLPPIRNTRTTIGPTTARITSERSRSGNLLDHVLNNRYLWAIAVANAFVTFVRYGVGELDSQPTSNRKGSHFSSRASAGACTSTPQFREPSSAAGSRQVFKGRARAGDNLFMASRSSRSSSIAHLHGPLWTITPAHRDRVLIYGPIMIIGLHALDLVPKKAAARPGFTGFFGYVLRIGHRGNRRRLDCGPLGLERRVRDDDCVLHPDDRLQRHDALATGGEGKGRPGNRVVPSCRSQLPVWNWKLEMETGNWKLNWETGNWKLENWLLATEIHSDRSVVNGSTRVARRAGRYPGEHRDAEQRHREHREDQRIVRPYLYKRAISIASTATASTSRA